MSNQPVIPKDRSGIAYVIKIGRISTDKQNIENIQASFNAIDDTLKRLVPGEMKSLCLGEQASGMLSERETTDIALREISTGKVDLVISEDLSRIFRHPAAALQFVFRCVDANVRVVAVGDGIDTADEIWFQILLMTVNRNGMFVPETQRRVRRTATHTFGHGGMVTRLGFGHRKLTREQAASGEFGPKGLQIAKDPDATPILVAMRNRVLQGESAPVVAKWLNEIGIRPGSSCSSRLWSGKLVKHTLRNPLHCGIRLFRRTLYKKLWSTGKMERKKNDNPNIVEHPELAHFTKDEFAELQRALDARDQRKQKPRESKRKGIARKNSIWPGQQMTCGICGGALYRTLNDQLKCQNAFAGVRTPCWNKVLVAAEQVRRNVIPRILQVIREVPEAWSAFIESAWAEVQHAGQRSAKEIESIDVQIRDLEKQSERLAENLAQGIRHPSVKKLFREIDSKLKALVERRAEVEANARSSCTLLSRQEVENQAEACLLGLARTSFAFGQLMRRAIPTFEVYPVQALDSGLVRPLGRVSFDPKCFLEDQTDKQDPCSATTIEVRLFEPPVHIRYAADCAKRKVAGPKMRLEDLASELGINRMSAKRALDYAKRMQVAGTTEEYSLLRERPMHASRWKKRAKK